MSQKKHYSPQARIHLSSRPEMRLNPAVKVARRFSALCICPSEKLEIKPLQSLKSDGDDSVLTQTECHQVVSNKHQF